ncbi:hypothetical protein AJ78_02892 [Emergomyces pasteurianus Ep9510]|uniref:Uncharacterized protein n=1 Tax=Emergomyces pasteurianus Ep9510 TaxID=1447872 RepID=A0A1J9Q9S6_9EURO|nr:hypothetical protein AJ78_02892 [Emergomyces pasteurianus Ep9510]
MKDAAADRNPFIGRTSPKFLKFWFSAVYFQSSSFLLQTYDGTHTVGLASSQDVNVQPAQKEQPPEELLSYELKLHPHRCTYCST